MPALCCCCLLHLLLMTLASREGVRSAQCVASAASRAFRGDRLAVRWVRPHLLLIHLANAHLCIATTTGFLISSPFSLQAEQRDLAAESPILRGRRGSVCIAGALFLAALSTLGRAPQPLYNALFGNERAKIITHCPIKLILDIVLVVPC